MSWLTRERTTRAALVAVALGAVLMVTLGAGYRASNALLEGAGAFVQKGHKVVHMNAESGESDADVAKALATGRQRLEVVQVGPDSVWVVNNSTGEVYRLATSDMKPEQVGTVGVGKSTGVKLVSGGDHGYLVDRKRGTLTSLDSRTDRRLEIKLPATPSEVAVDSAGIAWVYAFNTAELYQVKDGQVVSTQKVAEPKEKWVRLALVRDQPVIYRATAGEVRTFGAGAQRIAVPKVSKAVVVSTGSADASSLVWVVPSTATLYTVDIQTGDVHNKVLAGHEGIGLAQGPVVFSGRIYVPDQRQRQVVVVDLKSLEVLEAVGLPSGKESIELFVRDGRVWVNDPYAQTMLVFDRHGRHTVLDKGTGDGVDDDRRPKTKPTKPTTTPTARPTSRPTSEPTDHPTVEPTVVPTVVPTIRPIKPTVLPTKGRTTRSTPPKQVRKVEVPSFPRGTKYPDACRSLEELELRCNAVAGGESEGLGADEVIETRPPAGTKLEVGKSVTVSYVGPVRVPDVVGQLRDDACNMIDGARLRCQPNAESGVARTTDDLLKVTRQDPGSGSEADVDSPVSIHYLNKIRIRAFTGPVTEACKAITGSYHMECNDVEGDPQVGQCTKPGHIYHQAPTAGTQLSTESRITLTYCPGAVPVDNYRGLLHNPNDAQQQTACARVGSHGFGCSPVEGVSPVGIEGAQPYVVYDQNPTPPAKVAPGSQVTVVFYSNNGKSLENYDRRNADEACAEIRNQGYQCQGQGHLHPDASYVKSAVFRQDPAPGTYPRGTMVTLHYQDVQPVDWSIYKHASSDTYKMAPTGQPPDGFPGPAFRIGLAYQAGTNLAPHNDGNPINGYSCHSTPANCSGMVPNYFYTRDNPGFPGWSGPTPVATFLRCHAGAPPAGARTVYRVWKGDRTYGMVHDNANPPGWDASEFLGCVWWT